MEEKVISIEEGTLAYMRCRGGVSIRRYRGVGTRAVIPDMIDGERVVSIEKKAFLSCKTLREIILPDSIEEIGDWAFAHADRLRLVELPRHEYSRGRELFLGCGRLREIIRCGTSEERAQDEAQGIGRMLAAAVTILHDYFLLAPSDIGTDAWIERWDEQLKKLIELDDLEGFEELWTCGEEDYEGKDYDITSYPVEKRKLKIRMAYFRLLHPYKISPVMTRRLQEYLRSHTKGEAQPESWEVLLREHPQDIAYYRIFVDAGCINGDNFDAILTDAVNVSAEIKAYLLRYKDEHLEKKDAFAAFELDW